MNTNDENKVVLDKKELAELLDKHAEKVAENAMSKYVGLSLIGGLLGFISLFLIH